MNALNSENMSAVTSIIHLSVGMGLEEMVQPMISRLHSLKDESMAINVANTFLSSGNQTLFSAAESWATGKGYEIDKFGFAPPTSWGKW